MANDMQVLNLALMLLNNVVMAISSVYLPTLQAAEEECNVIATNESVQSLLFALTLLCRSLNDLLALAATCGQINIPRPRLEHTLHPDFFQSNFRGRNFFEELETCEHLFWSLSGKSIESFRQIVRDVTPYLQMYTHRRRPRVRDNPFRLDIRNRVLLCIIWLRMYPELVVLSGLFMVSSVTAERKIRFMLPVLWSYFKNFVKWPTEKEWLERANKWEMFPGAVAVIDGTRHQIQRPQTEPQQDFYSGHCRYHNFSTQIIMDNKGNIVYIQSGFLGHNNDSGQLHMMPSIGTNEELHLPAGVYILADKGYPCSYPLLTPYRHVGDDLRKQLFNREFSKHRIRIEHCIRRVKEYGAVHHLWRHERWMFPIVNELCAFLAQRHIVLSQNFYYVRYISEYSQSG